MCSELGEVEDDLKWRFTWEAQSHIPTLRLFLFHPRTNPSLHCRDLRVHLTLSRWLLLVSWFDGVDVLLRVPVPRVLIDGESPVSFSALEDHIEVKLVLLLPVGHRIMSTFDSISVSSADDGAEDSGSPKPLSLASDMKRLLGSGGVHFHCRNCQFNLTICPLRDFVEMPSVNWREVADNWFGACCCSFGGISEKLVTRYANSYTCAKGKCLVDLATVTICKDDLIGCEFTCSRGNDDSGEKSKSTILKNEDHKEQIGNENHTCEVSDAERNVKRLSHLSLESDSLASDYPPNRCCTHHVSGTLSDDRKLGEILEVLENQKSFLNGFLGNIFMVRSSNLSKDVEWVEFFCPQCCTLLGAYPCANGSAPVDGGVRFFKCYTSTSSPTGEPSDLFRDYTLERMFTNQLLDIAKDELSYRTVIRDLVTKAPMLQVVVINSNSWSCTGYCASEQSDGEAVPRTDLRPVIKVLFTECSVNKESEIRTIEDRISKGLVDEIFMLRRQIEETIESLLSQRSILPASYSSLQGLSLSSMKI